MAPGTEAQTSSDASESPAAVPQPSVLRSVGANALARMIMLPISAVLGIVVTRLIVEEYGGAAYGQYMLLVGIGIMIPFADLGISASVMNATAGAGDPRTDTHLRLTLISCMRILAICAPVVILLSLAITVSGSWERLLGSGLMPGSGPTAAALSLAVIGATLLVSFGERLLAGLGKYHLVVVIGGLQTPLVLAAILVSIKFDLAIGGYVAVVSYAATFLIGFFALALANRRIRPTLRQAVRDAPRLREVRGARVFDTAWPMLIQMIALPLAMQSDRVILSHVSGLSDLNEFSLATQMFGPAVTIGATAGIALWPIFARARAGVSTESVSPFRMSMLFGAVAAVLVVLISLASGVLSRLASGGTITLSVPLLAAFSILVILQAVKNPLGMYLTDARGLRFQAYMVVLMLPVNVVISVILARQLGAVGPVIGSIVGVGLFQVVANWWFIARRVRITDAEPGGRHASRPGR